MFVIETLQLLAAGCWAYCLMRNLHSPKEAAFFFGFATYDTSIFFH